MQQEHIASFLWSILAKNVEPEPNQVSKTNANLSKQSKTKQNKTKKTWTQGVALKYTYYHV